MRKQIHLILALSAGFLSTVVVPAQIPAASEMLLRVDTGEQAFIPEQDLELLIDGEKLSAREADLSDRTISEIKRQFETLKSAKAHYEHRGSLVDECFPIYSSHMYDTATNLRLRLSDGDLPAERRYRLEELASVSEVVFIGKILSSESGYIFGAWGSILRVQITQLLKGSLKDRESVRMFSRRYDLTLNDLRYCNDFPSAFVPASGDEILLFGALSQHVGPELVFPQLALPIREGSVHQGGVEFLQMNFPMSLSNAEAYLREELNPRTEEKSK